MQFDVSDLDFLVESTNTLISKWNIYFKNVDVSLNGLTHMGFI